jgi:putative ABC transport system permease protein
MQRLLQDLRFGFRLLLKRPVVTVAAVVALALGIGATTAMFSLADAFLLKPVPFLDSNRLTILVQSAPNQDNLFWSGVSPANFLDWQQQSSSFDGMAAFGGRNLNITGNGDPEQLQGFVVSANFFDVLGVNPAMGRGFVQSEDQPGSDRVAVLSYSFWERRFGADPGIVGKTIQLDGNSYGVAGVTPKNFDFPMSAEVWIPLTMNAVEKNRRDAHYLTIVGHLKEGVSEVGAAAELGTIGQREATAYPETDKGWGARVLTLREFVSGSLTRQYTLMILCAAVFLLLIAAANVANLQYARAAEREREMALRLALGASRLILIRQLLSESVLLGLFGAAVGLVIAKFGLTQIVSHMPREVAKYIAGWKDISLDVRALAFTICIAVLAGILSGLAPAFRSARTDLNQSLKEGGRSSSAGSARQRMRGVLVVSEVALALILLIGAGLMVKGVNSLLDADRAVVPDTLLTLRVNLPQARYQDPQKQSRFYDEALTGIRAIPGVQSATVATSVPFSGDGTTDDLTVEGLAPRAPGEQRTAQGQIISPGYFQTMRIPLLGGREFSDGDGPDSMLVAIVGKQLARRYWPDQDPIGKRVKVGQENVAPWLTVVGVAGDIKYDWLSRAPELMIYTPYRQTPRLSSFFAIRASSDPLELTRAIRSKIAAIDPVQPIFEVNTLGRVMTNSVIGLVYVASLMAAMGVIALVLSAVGVYGIISYSVTERTHEIGVRMALGAQRGEVLSMVILRGVGLTLAGLAIGLPVSILLARLLSGLIFGVGATDFSTFGGVSVVLLGVAILACYVPARRATRVDPMVALRYE